MSYQHPGAFGWVDSRGATLQGLSGGYRLWVSEREPAQEGPPISRWVARAEPKDGVIDLLAKWAESGRIGDFPKSIQARQHRFLAAIDQSLPLALIVEDAHVLRGAVLDKMRLLAERGAIVLLLGDLARIKVSTAPYTSFWQRAGFLVSVERPFG